MQLHIHPGALQGVLGAVAQQIVQHPPQSPAVRHHPHRVVGQGAHHCQPCGLEPFLVLAQGLICDFSQVQPGQLHRQHAGGRLGGLHQVLGKLFQAVTLALQHVDILLHPLVGHGLLFQQVHIVDDGGEGGFQVVGDVGDELGFEVLAAHPLRHRLGDGLAQVVQLLGVLPQVVGHVVAGDLHVQIALEQFPGTAANLLPAVGPAAQVHHQHHADDHPEKHGIAHQQHQRHQHIETTSHSHTPNQGNGTAGHPQNLFYPSPGPPQQGAADQGMALKAGAYGGQQPRSHRGHGRHSSSHQQ